jgi:putative transposase
VTFIDERQGHRVGDGLRWGVESMCAVLSEHGATIAPSTYYDARTRIATAQDHRDEQLKEQIVQVFRNNYGVYGARMIWLELNRQGIPVARCTVERLMGQLGLRGARRGRTVRTTRSDPAAKHPPDRVNRNFAPRAPNQLWVADFSYVSTWSGMVYVAFVIDAYARRILGWRVATSMTTALVLDALEHAVWTRRQEGAADLAGLVHHSDAGSQYTSITFTQRLADAGIDASVGSVGDAYDNALAESVIGLFKTELINREAPGAPSSRSRPRPCTTSTGSTTTGCLRSTATFRRLNSSRPTTVFTTPTSPRPDDSEH